MTRINVTSKPSMEAHVDGTRKFTTVIIEGNRYKAVGTAACAPSDTFDAQTGVDIALSRALVDYAIQVATGSKH